MIEAARAGQRAFREAATKFLKHAQDTINPSVTAADVREMLIQHILTEDIFSQVFDDGDFHRENNVAKELYALESTFFTGAREAGHACGRWSPTTPRSAPPPRRSPATPRSRPSSR